MLNYPAGYILAVQKRERAAHMHWTVFYLIKIENSSRYQELVSYPMPVCWIELFGLNKTTQATFPNSY